MGSPPLPPKKEVALALLANSSVFVHLDPRATGVVVPQWFKKQPQLVLQIGLNMAVPIPDLHLDDEGMSCTLSFNRSPFHCMVPWSSVYAMVDDEGRAMVWPDEVPPEIQAQARAKVQEGGTAPAKKEGTKRPRLEGVKSDGPAAGAKKKARSEPRTTRVTPVRAVEVPPPPLDAERSEEGSAPAGPVAVPSEPRSPSPNGAGKKPRRELPPYLRIVK